MTAPDFDDQAHRSELRSVWFDGWNARDHGVRASDNPYGRETQPRTRHATTCDYLTGKQARICNCGVRVDEVSLG